MILESNGCASLRKGNKKTSSDLSRNGSVDANANSSEVQKILNKNNKSGAAVAAKSVHEDDNPSDLSDETLAKVFQKVFDYTMILSGDVYDMDFQAKYEQLCSSELRHVMKTDSPPGLSPSASKNAALKDSPSFNDPLNARGSDGSMAATTTASTYPTAANGMLASERDLRKINDRYKDLVGHRKKLAKRMKSLRNDPHALTERLKLFRFAIEREMAYVLPKNKKDLRQLETFGLTMYSNYDSTKLILPREARAVIKHHSVKRQESMANGETRRSRLMSRVASVPVLVDSTTTLSGQQVGVVDEYGNVPVGQLPSSGSAVAGGSTGFKTQQTMGMHSTPLSDLERQYLDNTVTETYVPQGRRSEFAMDDDDDVDELARDFAMFDNAGYGGAGEYEDDEELVMLEDLVDSDALESDDEERMIEEVWYDEEEPRPKEYEDGVMGDDDEDGDGGATAQDFYAAELRQAL